MDANNSKRPKLRSPCDENSVIANGNRLIPSSDDGAVLFSQPEFSGLGGDLGQTHAHPMGITIRVRAGQFRLICQDKVSLAVPEEEEEVRNRQALCGRLLLRPD